jgi:hypothetical protein
MSEGPLRVNRDVLTMHRVLPVFLGKQTCQAAAGISQTCQGPTSPICNAGFYVNNSTVANGSADHGRKRFNVNFVFCPGWTSTRR